MVADNNSGIAWHRVQIRKNREAVKGLEMLKFAMEETGSTEAKIAELKRKITDSERCIAEHERRTRRPLPTDLQTLASVSWSDWDASTLKPRRNASR